VGALEHWSSCFGRLTSCERHYLTLSLGRKPDIKKQGMRGRSRLPLGHPDI